MRELKFRAFDGEDNEIKTMIYSDGRNKEEYQANYDFTIDEEGKIVCIWIEDYDDSFGYSTTREGKLDNIMQYTGLKDCNNNEIYEGDILEGFDNRFIAKFGNVKLKKVAPNGSINEIEMTCFYLEDMQGNPLFPITKNYKGEHDMQSLKIIGNIYENPELGDYIKAERAGRA